uniref:Ribitol-5-phosphate transferase n=1 Tax=Cyanoderma ruficeps TaxID=181631 RepID=A0A8C3QND0_9PASS
MRITPCQAALAAAITLNLLLLLCSRLSPIASPPCRGDVPAGVPRTLSKGVTVILRDFHGPEHDVAATSRSFSSLPGVPVLVVGEAAPYPPAVLPAGVSVLSLRPEPQRPAPRPELAVVTRHVAFVPDGARAVPGLLRHMRDALEGAADGAVKMVAAGVGSKRPRCLGLEVDVKTWTARYSHPSDQSDHQSDQSDQQSVQCGALDGAPVVLLLRTRDLFSLPFPLTTPVVTSLSFQAALRGWRLLLLPNSFPSSSPPPSSPHSQWKTRNFLERQHRELMELFGVKLELLPAGGRRWHGCTKDTPRCFGTIHAQTPQYLLAGRWTPPCCLQALRTTARHVLAQLESSGIRHWLEGGSLLGAVRLGDIIPWDYDVDVGLYLEDVPKCPWLAAVAATGRPVEDPQGFFWEKAAEGEFFRVHFSRSNRLHVDLWPFYPDGRGMMTKDTWLGHGQDVEFPESFLVPLGSVTFAGAVAKAPNEPRKFLEFKFGPGAVENPQYPNPGVRRLEQDLGTSNKPPR